MAYAFKTAALLFLLHCSWYWLPASSSNPMDMFEQWIAQHGRQYKDESEKLYRLGVFTGNMERVSSFLQSDKRSYTIGLNRFADLTTEEFIATFTGARSISSNTSKPAPMPFPYANMAAPSRIDWRDNGMVTPIKDQGSCGSCWAFSSVASIESINKIARGKLISLSEQELVACDYNDAGCDGGLHYNAFAFVVSNGGITTEENYPYQPDQSACDAAKLSDHAVSITGYSLVPTEDEASLMKAVANQPVSVSIDASEFMLYTGGIFDGPCEANLNHEVTLVGYGTDKNGTNYWIAKNSWGESWGDQGYLLLQKDVAEKEGLCGLAIRASFPII
ncbi:zingipain-1-like [Canna indica]|uniref:Zingipain-1-like n=1 Tax=Canna indica TaxID=4628 RepID=A0AAQ3KAV8_9LILI|nr:zingipain-1-like [Canna indica]